MTTTHPNAPNSSNIDPAIERRAAIKWTAVVVGILGASFIFAMVTLYHASTDPSFAVEPDYYEKALNWDEHAALREASAQLGWTIGLSAGPGAEPGRRIVTMALSDREGEPIENADVSVVAFHNARAANRHEFSMDGVGAGVYTTDQPLNRPGHWEFRFTIMADGSTFIHTKPVRLAALGGAR